MLFDRSLQIRWAKLCHSLRFNQNPAIYLGRLTNAYNEKHRTYHTVAHIQSCLDELDLVLPLAEQPKEVEFALWFHDVIYEAAAADNEERSADWAAQMLQENGVPSAIIRNIQTLILATKHNRQLNSSDAHLIVDIDLAILGASESRFDQYESQIRQEYQQVADEPFRMGRALILQSFLKRESIYYTPTFQERYESQARANLQRSIDKLQSLR